MAKQPETYDQTITVGEAFDKSPLSATFINQGTVNITVEEKPTVHAPTTGHQSYHEPTRRAHASAHHEPQTAITADKPIYDAQGKLVTKWHDNKGGSVSVVTDGQNTETTFSGFGSTTITHSNSPGFNGSSTGFESPLSLGVNTTPQSARNDIPFFARVNCGDDSRHVTPHVVDQVTIARIDAFAKEHPQLAEEVRQANVNVTNVDGRPATMEHVENTPSSFTACPANRPGIVVERIAGKP